MTKKEYLEKLRENAIVKDKVGEVRQIYGCELPEIVQRIVSDCEKTIFLDDDMRILSFAEIMEAEQDLHVNFKEKGIIPLIDCGENDFIVYHLKNRIWSKFNIIDETVFKKKNELDELLK